MKITFLYSLFVFIPMIAFNQRSILVREHISNKIGKLKQGKVVGLITNSMDTIKYADKNTYTDNAYWYLKSFTDSSLTVAFKKTEETKTYLIKNIKQISFKKNESTGSPVAMAAGGLILVVISPFVGIQKDEYDFKQAGLTLGVGTGLLSLVYLTTKNKDLRHYKIIGFVF